jgi:hypothetical protein
MQRIALSSFIALPRKDLFYFVSFTETQVKTVICCTLIFLLHHV